jgi:hypothetical protein
MDGGDRPLVEELKSHQSEVYTMTLDSAGNATSYSKVDDLDSLL